MAKYAHRLYDLVQDLNKPVIIKGNLVYSALRKRVQRQGYQQNPDYEAWVVGVSDPEIVKGQDTDLAKHLSTVDETSRSFHTNNNDNYAGDTTFFIESKSPRGIMIVDGKTKQGMPGDELLEHELAPNQPVQLLVRMIPSKQGINMLVLDAVEIEDANNIKYRDGMSQFADVFGTPDPNAAPLKPAKNPGKSDDTPAQTEEEAAGNTASAASTSSADDDIASQQQIEDMFGDAD